MTNHAAVKMLLRGVTLSQVEQAVWHPQVVYSNTHGQVRQHGSIAVGVVEDGQDVIVRTVLLRSPEQWDDEQARTRQGGTK